MFWNKNKKEQIGGIQTQLQSEDNNFHRTIIALERLERFLNSERERSASELKLTAVGTDRDYHDDVKHVPTRDSYFMELALQCNTLYMTAHYDDSEVFRIAVESFMKDLLEWYAGRYLLDYYDEVDASVIPIIVAITYESNNVSEIFQKYVYTIPSVERTQEEKYIMVKEGVEAWLLGRHYAEVSANNSPIQTGNESYVTPHVRGTALDGYKRIIAALTTSFDTSAPVKMFYKMVNKYLPGITKQISDINEEAIDELYEKKAHGFSNATKKYSFQTKIEKGGVQYCLLYIPDPTLLVDGHLSQSIVWKHLNENCGGDIYIGNNGCFYCEKCGEEIEVSECSFHSNGFIEFDTKPNFELKTLSESISISDFVTDVESLEWLRKLTESFEILWRESHKDIDQLYPLLYEKVKEILDAHSIKYSEINIEVK